MKDNKKNRLKLPLTPEQIKELPYPELMALNSLEKHWQRILISRDGVWRELGEVELTVSKPTGYEIAKGEKVCPVCKGENNHRVKTREVGLDTGLQRTFFVECECRNWVFLHKLLDNELPPRYRNTDLDTLEADVLSTLGGKDNSSKGLELRLALQDNEIEHLRKNSLKSYFFVGPAGSSKTTFITALYRHALEENVESLRDPFKENVKFIWRVDAQNLLEQFQTKSTDNTAPEPDVTKPKLDHLRKKYGVKPVVILEEIDKLKASKFRLDKLFDVIDGVYENEGTLILSSNLTVGEFEEAFGEPIYRRVKEMCDTRDYYNLANLKYEKD
jgi:DNA replication protein DnaC